MAAVICSILFLTGCGNSEKVTPEDYALAVKAETLAKEVNGNPAQEMTNMLIHEWQYKLIKMLKGEEVELEGVDLTAARKQVNNIIDNFMLKGKDWPVLRGVKIPYASQKIKIDGSLTDKAWEKAAAWQGGYPFGEKEKKNQPATEWKVLWDENYLYFAFDCRDTDIIAPQMKRDTPVYHHDCVEMFILPDFEQRLYWEIVISPSGSIYDGLNFKKYKGWGMVPEKDLNVEGMKTGVKVNGTIDNSADKDKGYIVEAAVPFKALPGYTRGNKPKNGDKLNFMLVRLDKNGDKHSSYAFQPLLNWGHNIWNHAEVQLTK
jgi:hypothetical protein